MVDLKTQHSHLQPELNNKILEVVESAAYIKGAEVQKFERELEQYLNVKHVIACANGTDALQLAMMALGLKPGDEVITTNFTYVATAEILSSFKELIGDEFTFHDLVNDFGAMFEADNPRFNFETFREACEK